MIPRMMRVMLHVKDIETVSAFYTNVLGCTVKAGANADWTELEAGGCAIALHKWSSRQSDRGKSWAVIAFGVEDVPTTRRELMKKGAKMGVVHSVDIPPYEGLQFCTGKDPEGNSFQITNRGVTSCLYD